jgi:hypothetical protein
MAISQKKRALLAEQPDKGQPLPGFLIINQLTGGIAHRYRRQPTNMRPPKRRRDDR